jgi:hypothetical protein
MENFKIEIWIKDGIHIEYNSLNRVQSMQLLDTICMNYNIIFDKDKQSSFFIQLSDSLQNEISLYDINEPEGFKNLCTLLKIDIFPDQLVYVIWNFNDIDAIQSNVLKDYWDYIWYGTSDEMCLLYFSLSKQIVLITDYGSINYTSGH